MAQKRMFSMQIVDTDAFLEMPMSSQLLYFHLVMRADDEGFIGNPKRIIRLIGAQDDDLKVLIAKRFLLTFESGVIVIKHWLIHNTIRMDRFNKTVYGDEKNLITTKENKAYTMATTWQPLGNHLEPQVKLSKVKLSKKEQTADKLAFGEFKKVFLSSEEHQKLIEKMGEKNTTLLIAELDTYLASKNKKYASHYATLLSWMRRKVTDYQQKKTNIAF